MYIDLLTQINNIKNAGKDIVKVPHSNMNKRIADILVEAGYLKAAEVKGRGPKKMIKISLNKDKPISGIKFLSKPSLLKYSGYSDLRPVKGGHGTLVVSTSKGILKGESAKKEKLGGQLLFEIW